MRFFFVLLGLVILSPSGFSQAPGAEDERPYRAGTITVRFVGTANVNEQVVRANMQVKEGAELDDTMIDRDIRALYKTGLFEFIEVKREIKDRTVNLIVDVTPKFRVSAVKYEGNDKVKSRRLQKEAKTKAGGTLDERQVKEDAEKMREYYQKAGFYQASVSYKIERDAGTGYGTVIFRVREGPKVRIKDFVFVGNDHIKARKLRKTMETKRWWMFSWLTGSGRLKDEMFEDDLDKLRDTFREEGFLDVEIPQDKIEIIPHSKKRIKVKIVINEGKRYRIGDVAFTGNKLYPARLLNLITQQKSGMVFGPSKIDKDVETLEDFYGKDGYLDTRVKLVRKPNIATGNIDIEYQIAESEQFFVESIRIEGNTKSKSLVILRELTLGPGEVFDTISMKRSKMRLDNTRFFDDVNVSPESTNIPGRRNLKIVVKEGRTGNLQFGAGFSTLEKAMFFTELSQSNFDLFNRKSFFQGDGQKFRMRLQIGSVSSEAMINFEEPYFLEKELGVGFSIYRTTSNYTNSYYDDVRTGGQVYARKRLFELVEGQLAYSYENVKIESVNAGYELYFPPGTTEISKVTLTLLRDTRDKLINTTDGGRIELTTEVAGGPLSGTYDFYRLEARGSQFFPIFRTQDQVIALIGRVGVLDSYNNSQVPYYERFTLGGPYTLRGFEYRDVSPRTPEGFILGGQSYGMISVEYSIDIVSPVRFVLFYDGGFVNADAYDFNPADYNDNFGFGIRLFVAGAPLAIDYGIPLTSDRYNRKGNQFNFSFGTRF
ncbi:MAG: outer membrane protein assembly factor BamA [Opitutaceae bacterium]|nr:outer membrane protein assembly factor BamA [Opitutaceae bacterium]